MLSVQEVLALIEEHVPPLNPRPVLLEEAWGLRLRQEVVSQNDEPPFHRSAMDGFAVSLRGQARDFVIGGEILPGDPPPPAIPEGTTLRVFTGSALPEGAGVFKQEDVREADGKIRVSEEGVCGYVRRQGSIARAGDILVPHATLLGPAELAVLAANGITQPLVTPRPRVAHLTTGREIVGIGQVPAPGQIRNANATLIRELVTQCGAALSVQAHADESLPSALAACRQPAFSTADVFMVSGGSSHGKYDRTRALFQELGFTTLCETVNCRPGKPFLFATRGSQVAVGLPGNPISHFVTFHLFVRKVLQRMAEGTPRPPERMRLSEGAQITQDARETFWPARLLDSGGVCALPWLDSGHLAALMGVNALLHVPAQSLPRPGELVEVIPTG